MKKSTAITMTHAFVTHWVLIYGPPIWMSTENEKKFSAKFFHDVFLLLGTENLYTTTYHKQKMDP